MYPTPTTPAPMAKFVRFRRNQLRVAVIMSTIYLAGGIGMDSETVRARGLAM
jgi:hypothetical protein